MAKTHNKKRNVGIIYEQLLRNISQSLVEGNEEKAQVVTQILTNNFKPGTQLYREFRLFNSLIKTTVDSDALAVRILGEAKKAALEFDSNQLRKEKASLIKEINHTLDDQAFYSQRIKDYRSYATIQTLLNDWRKDSPANIGRVASYESKVCGWLREEKQVDDISVHRNDDVDSLTVKIMTEKFNKKYHNSLNDEQAEIIKEYIFALKQKSYASLTEYLSDIKDATLAEVDTYALSCNNVVLNEKMDVIKRNVESLDPKEVNDNSISRFLLVSALKTELLENEND